MTTLEIQRRLGALGFHPGPLDGVRGRITIAAIRAFQRESGLQVDGLAGPRTLAQLFDAPAASGIPAADAAKAEAKRDCQQMRPWYAEATRLKALKEAPGSANNQAILDWAGELDLAYAADSIPWCGLFVAHCIAVALPDEPLPTNPLGARNWLKFGVSCDPTLGAVLAFWRGRKSGWQGHVGFYAGEDAAAFHVLGGNQADSVSVARIARSRLLGARWPTSVPEPAAVIRIGDAGAELSTDEA